MRSREAFGAGNGVRPAAGRRRYRTRLAAFQRATRQPPAHGAVLKRVDRSRAEQRQGGGPDNGARAASAIHHHRVTLRLEIHESESKLEAGRRLGRRNVCVSEFLRSTHVPHRDPRAGGPGERRGPPHRDGAPGPQRGPARRRSCTARSRLSPASHRERASRRGRRRARSRRCSRIPEDRPQRARPDGRRRRRRTAPPAWCERAPVPPRDTRVGAAAAMWRRVCGRARKHHARGHRAAPIHGLARHAVGRQAPPQRRPPSSGVRWRWPPSLKSPGRRDRP